MTKITLGAIGILLVALLILGKLYLNKSNAHAVEQERTKGLVASYEMLNAKYMKDQQKIKKRDQAVHELSETNRELRHELDEALGKDPAAQKWAAGPVPPAVRDFVQQSQRTAIELSRPVRRADGPDPDT